MSDRERLFDNWARTYDMAVQRTDRYPFAGYDDVLDAIARATAVRPGDRVLDLGVGTGTLAGKFAELGCEVWGLDFSERMLERARVRFPDATFLKADLLNAWPEELPNTFDAVASGYVLHEFPTDRKLDIISHALDLLQPGKPFVVGDIAFETRGLHDAAQEEWFKHWDHEESYWVWEEIEPLLRDSQVLKHFTTVSICAGVMTFQRTGDD